MSKKSEAKERQGYVPKFIPNVCGNCLHFRSEIVKTRGTYGLWTKETNMRCEIGGFKVKKQGTCQEWAGQS